jgi:hypothetical protein
MPEIRARQQGLPCQKGSVRDVWRYEPHDRTLHRNAPAVRELSWLPLGWV